MHIYDNALHTKYNNNADTAGVYTFTCIYRLHVLLNTCPKMSNILHISLYYLIWRVLYENYFQLAVLLLKNEQLPTSELTNPITIPTINPTYSYLHKHKQTTKAKHENPHHVS